jgi:hypothetical protein
MTSLIAISMSSDIAAAFSGRLSMNVLSSMTR